MDQIGCPSCGKQFQVNPSYYGKSFQCPCGQMVNVPHPGMAAPPPPPPPRAGYGAPGPQQGVPPSGTPGIVIAGFILSFFPCVTPVGLILCAVGLGEAKRRNAGTGLAVAGIIISSLMMLTSIILWAAANPQL